MIVTTTYEPSESTTKQSKKLSEELNCKWVPRKKNSLVKLNSLHHESCIFVVSDKEIKYYHGDQPPLFFHPSTAMVRVKRLIQGEQDTLVKYSNFVAGDSLLDCTAGMASDSIVFSFHGGAASDITALESEFVPYVILREGLNRYSTEIPALNDAMRRIRLKQEHHLSYLKRQPDKSIDIIYFDPMFQTPIEESSSLSPLRHVANHESLELESVNQAKRVARKSVVLKEQWESGEYERLGFTNVFKTYSKIAYGVIPI
jgi:16S rRNA (guanine1516-N2)-methyltransferase